MEPIYSILSKPLGQGLSHEQIIILSHWYEYWVKRSKKTKTKTKQKKKQTNKTPENNWELN